MQLRWAAISGIVSVLTVALLVSGLLHYHGKAASAQESIKQLQREASGQAAIIASQALYNSRSFNEAKSTLYKANSYGYATLFKQAFEGGILHMPFYQPVSVTVVG